MAPALATNDADLRRGAELMTVLECIMRKILTAAVAALTFGGAVVTAAAPATAASFHGGRLVTEAPDSPHLLASRIKGEMYFACAETDHWAPLPMVEALRAHLETTGIDFEVEIYGDSSHGFAFPQRAVYKKEAAERHWERLFALFRRRLG